MGPIGVIEYITAPSLFEYQNGTLIFETTHLGIRVWGLGIIGWALGLGRFGCRVAHWDSGFRVGFRV